MTASTVGFPFKREERRETEDEMAKRQEEQRFLEKMWAHAEAMDAFLCTDCGQTLMEQIDEELAELTALLVETETSNTKENDRIRLEIRSRLKVKGWVLEIHSNLRERNPESTEVEA